MNSSELTISESERLEIIKSSEKFWTASIEELLKLISAQLNQHPSILDFHEKVEGVIKIWEEGYSSLHKIIERLKNEKKLKKGMKASFLKGIKKISQVHLLQTEGLRSVIDKIDHIENLSYLKAFETALESSYVWSFKKWSELLSSEKAISAEIKEGLMFGFDNIAKINLAAMIDSLDDQGFEEDKKIGLIGRVELNVFEIQEGSPDEQEIAEKIDIPSEASVSLYGFAKSLKDISDFSNQQINDLLIQFRGRFRIKLSEINEVLQNSVGLSKIQIDKISLKIEEFEHTYGNIEHTDDVREVFIGEGKEGDSLIDFKSNLGAIFANLSYYLKTQRLPWWTVYESEEELRRWVKKVRKSNKSEYLKELSALVEHSVIRELVTDFQKENLIQPVKEDQVDLKESKVFKDLLIASSKVNDPLAMADQEWFYNQLFKLFGSNSTSSLGMKKGLLRYVYHSVSQIDSSKIIQLKQNLIDSEMDSSQAIIRLFDELDNELMAYEENKLFIESVMIKMVSLFQSNAVSDQFLNEIRYWISEEANSVKDKNILLNSVLKKVSYQIALTDKSTQANAILKLIRHNSDELLTDVLYELSDQLEHDDWFEINEDESLLHELYNFLNRNDNQKESKVISGSSLFKHHKTLKEIENGFPSLYLLAMALVEKAEKTSTNLESALNSILDVVNEDQFGTLSKNLNLLKNSDWIKEQLDETNYSTLFADLEIRQRDNEKKSVQARFADKLDMLLSDSSEFYKFVKEIKVESESGSATDKDENENINEDWIKVKDGDRIFIKNAGLVMLWPFLSTLFKNLGYTEDKAFKNFHDQERAVHLLQYLVDGEENSPEFILVLNKILCGIPPNEPIRRFVDLTQEEKDEAKLFLSTVISRWEQMKNTSIDVFRDTFLKRDGALMYKNEKWRLKVEYKSIDILLIKLPWGMSMIKFPWTKYIIFVEWKHKN